MTTVTKARPAIYAHFWHAKRPWWIAVRCEWHGVAPIRNGCMLCGPLIDRVLAFVRSDAWQEWLLVVREDPSAAPILADWLEEQGQPVLADEARRTAFVDCPTCKGKGGFGHTVESTADWGGCYPCKQTGKVLRVNEA